MITIVELVQNLLEIQNALDNIEIKGVKNASILTQTYDLCSHMVSDLKNTVEEIQNESKEKGEVNAQIDSESS